MPKKILGITGGSGRVGYYAVKRLLEEWQVVVIDQKPPRAELKDVNFRQVDILNYSEVKAALREVDAVLHLAAVDLDAHQFAEVTINVNVMGTWNVLQASSELGIARVVICSSVTASGVPEMRPDWVPDTLPITEEHEDRPVHPYGVSKRITEFMAESYTYTGKMSVICLRAMMVALPENIQFLMSLSTEPPAKWTFSYIGPEDLSDAFAIALKADMGLSGVYYISADDTCSFENSEDLIHRIWKGGARITDPEYFQEYPRGSLFSNKKALLELGFTPRTVWSDFVE